MNGKGIRVGNFYDRDLEYSQRKSSTETNQRDRYSRATKMFTSFER